MFRYWRGYRRTDGVIDTYLGNIEAVMGCMLSAEAKEAAARTREIEKQLKQDGIEVRTYHLTQS